jgi:hypothetical protein
MRASIVIAAALLCLGADSNGLSAQRAPAPPPPDQPTPQIVPPTRERTDAQRTGQRIGVTLGLLAGGLIGWAALPDRPEGDLGYAAAPLLVGLSAGAGAVVGGYVGLAIATVVDDGHPPRTSVALVIGGVP